MENIREHLKGKRLLVLGGSLWKSAIKDFVDEYGVVIVAAAKYRVGIFDIADECHIIDITDRNVMIPFIKQHNIDGVYMGGAEPVIAAACEYINFLGMPCYCTPQSWEALQDKRLFKRLCIENELPVVPMYCLQGDDVKKCVPTDDYPVIVKPADGCGSNGFSVCNNCEELCKAYVKAKDNSPTGSVICEKFVNNKSVGFFATFSNGRMFFSGLEDKIPVRYEREGSYVGGIFLFESHLVDIFRQKFEARIAKLFAAVGVTEGNAWIEVFYDNGQFYFNEVGFRYGGSVSIYPICYFHNYNQVASDIYFALTGKSKIYGFQSLIPVKVPRKEIYVVYPVHILAGKIAGIEGVEEIAALDRIVTFKVTKKNGDEVTQSGSFTQVFALAHFVCDTLDACKAMIEHIHRTVKVLDTSGNNLVNRMLNSDDIMFLA